MKFIYRSPSNEYFKDDENRLHVFKDRKYLMIDLSGQISTRDDCWLDIFEIPLCPNIKAQKTIAGNIFDVLFLSKTGLTLDKKVEKYVGQYLDNLSLDF